MKKRDDAMAKNPRAERRADGRGRALRAEGQTLQQAGQHRASIDTSAGAMKILGIS